MREPLDVRVKGVTKFHARPGAFKGRKAIQIEQTIATVAALPPVPSPGSSAQSAAGDCGGGIHGGFAEEKVSRWSSRL